MDRDLATTNLVSVVVFSDIYKVPDSLTGKNFVHSLKRQPRIIIFQRGGYNRPGVVNIGLISPPR